MSEISKIQSFEQARRFCFMRQELYDVRYPQSSPSQEKEQDRASAVHARVISKERVYQNNSPLRNEMDRWGREPGICLVSGLARWTFSLIELGVGMSGMVAAFVWNLVVDFLRIDAPCPFEEKSVGIGSQGGHDFWNGLKETLNLPMAKARGFQTGLTHTSRGSFRAQQGEC